jgi:hypothetical protein
VWGGSRREGNRLDFRLLVGPLKRINYKIIYDKSFGTSKISIIKGNIPIAKNGNQYIKKLFFSSRTSFTKKIMEEPQNLKQVK